MGAFRNKIIDLLDRLCVWLDVDDDNDEDLLGQWPVEPSAIGRHLEPTINFCKPPRPRRRALADIDWSGKSNTPRQPASCPHHP